MWSLFSLKTLLICQFKFPQDNLIGSLITNAVVRDPFLIRSANMEQGVGAVLSLLEAVSHCKFSKRDPVMGKVTDFSNRIPSKYEFCSRSSFFPYFVNDINMSFLFIWHSLIFKTQPKPYILWEVFH